MGAPPPYIGAFDVTLQDVAAAGPCSAWAVSSFDDGGTMHTLILGWNGTKWSVVPSPNRGPGANFLRGVTAISPTDAWAVGSYRGPVDPARWGLGGGGLRGNVPDPVDRPLLLSCSI